MKYETNRKTDKTKSFRISKTCAIAGLVIPLMLLTSCGWNSKESVKNLNIYQTSTLRLEKGRKIQTLDGVYTPQLDETWHSDARFRKLERESY